MQIELELIGVSVRKKQNIRKMNEWANVPQPIVIAES
jgi:hypothetical protein